MSLSLGLGLALTRNKGVPIPSGYAAIRIGSPVSYQTLIIGGAGSAPRVLVPVGG